MNSAGAVVALVLLEWTAGWAAGAAWVQSWGVVRRGHFRITAWLVAVLAVLTLVAFRDLSARPLGPQVFFVLAVAGLAYLAAQYVRSERPAIGAGGVLAALGFFALGMGARAVDGWPPLAAALQLIAGAVLLGAVTNGMMLGHWYLNQPGLQPWALERLTTLSLAGIGLSIVAGVVGAGRLLAADTSGAVLGLPGFGEDFGTVFFVVWIALVGLTGAVLWAARRCVKLRSIQSATGLLYVALVSAGASDFLV
ncbi:MAG TPA: hypothetical protein VHJ82_10330, partial [Actinomycetota bacterium]|nr:hypothetical protein [Actinomycetota bacterium]